MESEGEGEDMAAAEHAASAAELDAPPRQQQLQRRHQNGVAAGAAGVDAEEHLDADVESEGHEGGAAAQRQQRAAWVQQLAAHPLDDLGGGGGVGIE